MVKNLLRTVLFLGIFFLLFLGLSFLFIPKDNAPEAGIHEPDAKGFLGEPDHSIDVVFIGDSETFSSFIPLEIWQDYGITSYVCSTGNQVMYQSYAYLQRFFRTQSPQIVVLETNALFREYTLADLASYTMEEYLPYLRYHDRWKSLRSWDLSPEVDHTYLVPDKGYMFRTRAIPADDSNYMVPSEEVYEVPLISQWYLRAFDRFCEERGVTLILVSTPSTTNWDYYYHNGVTMMAEELDIPYMDMNLMSQEIPIDWQTDNYDGGDHLNYFGATKVTSYMGEYLHNTGLFTDKRGDAAYQQWDLALADFNSRLLEQ